MRPTALTLSQAALAAALLAPNPVAAQAEAPPAAPPAPAAGTPTAPSQPAAVPPRSRPAVTPDAPDANARSLAQRFRGSSVTLSFSANLNAFAPALQLTQNTTVDAALLFRPRFYIARDWQLRGGFNLLYEFTDSDSTTTINELRASDTFVDLWFHGIPSWRSLRFWAAARLSFPTSLESQMRTMIVSPSLLTQASFTVDHVAGGAFAVIANASYQHPFYSYTTGGVVGNYGYTRPCFGTATDSCGQQLSGVANVSDAVSWSVVVAQDWGVISPGVLFSMTHAHAYEFDIVGAYRAAGLPLPTETSFPSWRQTATFAVWLDATPWSWLTFEVGYTMSRNVLDANGQYGNPLFAQYQDMRLYLQTVFTPDRLYEQLTRRDASGRGVLRTRTEPRQGAPRAVLF